MDRAGPGFGFAEVGEGEAAAHGDAPGEGPVQHSMAGSTKAQLGGVMGDQPTEKAKEFVQALREALLDLNYDPATIETRYEDGGVWVGWPGLTSVFGTVTLTRAQLESANIRLVAFEAAKRLISMAPGSRPE